MPTPLPISFRRGGKNNLRMPDWVTGSSDILAIRCLCGQAISATTNSTGGGVTPLYEKCSGDLTCLGLLKIS